MTEHQTVRPLDTVPEMDHEAVLIHASELRRRFPSYTAEQALAHACAEYHESVSVAGVQMAIPLNDDVIVEIRDRPEGFFR
jgi:hypothetical protein